MSSVPTSIAASVSQAAIQQGQTARANDAPRNRQAEQSRQMKQLLDKHLQEVEDPSETDAHRSRIHDEQHEADTERRRQKHQDHIDLQAGDELAPVEPPAPPPASGDDPPLYHHLDVEA